MATDIRNIEVPRKDGSPEAAREFIPTPERVSQYLELKSDEVATQMKSVEGRKALYDQLIVHEKQLKKDHKNFDAVALRSTMDDIGESLAANERYMKDIRSPEKKGLFTRAWESVKAFPRKHPVVTALLATAALVGGVAAGFYLTGNMELLLSSVGLSHLYGEKGAAAAAETMGNLIDGATKVPDYFDAPEGGLMQ